MTADPHAGATFARTGAAPGRARLGLVLLHGRGGSAADILGLARLLARDDVAVIAPEAAGNSWWPTSFLAPLARLEPWLGSALAATGRAVAALMHDHGLPQTRIALAGFSQGGCLALEAALRSGGRWHAVAGLSAGLVGTGETGEPPDPALHGHLPKRFDYPRPLDGTPVLLACHDRDPHIPRARVERTAEVVRAAGGVPETLIYPGEGHGLERAGLAAFRALLDRPGPA